MLIDLGVPRNVAPTAGDLYNVHLYNIDDLTEIVQQNKKAREEEIPRAEAIIEEHLENFMRWHAWGGCEFHGRKVPREASQQA
jgi:glutamyl-tRNA reductase